MSDKIFYFSIEQAPSLSSLLPYANLYSIIIYAVYYFIFYCEPYRLLCTASMVFAFAAVFRFGFLQTKNISGTDAICHTCYGRIYNSYFFKEMYYAYTKKCSKKRTGSFCKPVSCLCMCRLQTAGSNPSRTSGTEIYCYVQKTPEHGTLTASLDGKDFTGGEVEKGKIIIFTAEPEPPYRVRKWTGLENAGSKTVVTLTVTKTADVSVEFVKVPEHTITFTQPEHGKLIARLEGKDFISGDKVPEGKPIIFIALPDAGYRLLTWKNIDTDPEHGYTKAYIVRGEKTVSVTFEPDENLTIRGPENNRYVESCKRTAEGRIEIPPDVKRIYGGAFRDCVKVTEVVLPDGITEIIQDTFKGCTGLTSVAMPSVTQIGYSAFFRCTGLTSVTMPSVTQIRRSAFYGCTGLTSVTMPSVTQIGRSAFGGCTELTNIAIDNSNPFFCAEGSIIYNKDKTELIFGAGNLTQLTIPETVTQIGDSAFGGCTGLTSVTMPSVTQIGEHAFSGCTGLTSVTMPSVTQIGDSAFGGCTGLTSVTMPSVTRIGERAFSGCTGLTSVTMPSVTQIRRSAFYGCTGLTSVTMPSVTQIGEHAFDGCTGLKDITIESMNLTEIGTRAFYNIHTDAKFKVKTGGNVKEKLKAIGIAEDKIIEQ